MSNAQYTVLLPCLKEYTCASDSFSIPFLTIDMMSDSASCTMTICTGTACYIKGTDKLLASAEEHLRIHEGQTTQDGQISLMTARCVGACGRAPVVLLDGELHGQMSGGEMIAELERWKAE